MLRSLALLSLVAVGCDREPSLQSRTAVLDEQLNALGAESDLHAGRIAAASIVTIGDIESEHHARLQELLRGLDLAVDNVLACRSAMMGEMRGLGDDMAELRRECDDHRDRMLAAPDIPGAHAEEGRHYRALQDLIGAMRARRGSAAGTMVCRR